MVDLEAAIGELSLVDHHVHGALREDVGRETLESFLTESDRPVPAWMTQFDSPLGFAVRRWCAPVLGLPPHASTGDYVARRAELGAREVNRRLLSAAGIGHYLLDTGVHGDAILDLAGMAEEAAGEWLRAVETTGTARVEDPVLSRFLLWSGLDRGLPLQLHTGYGDPDLALDRCDPLLLTP